MIWNRTAWLALAGATALTTPGLAREPEPTREALEARVERLERLVEQLMERLNAQEQARRSGEVDLLSQSARLDDAEASVSAVEGRVAAVDEQLESMSQFFERERMPGFSIGDTQVTFGGYVKLDIILAAYSDGAPPSNSPGRDFYIPSTVPAGTESGRQTVFDFNPRESRFLFQTSTPAGDHALRSHIELDFLVTSNDDELVSNSFTPRMRQAFLTYRGFLFGQAWSTFQNIHALPENLDFIGPTEGTVFIRQPMIRYARGPFEVALENPETTVTDRDGGRIMTDSDNVPDLALRYTWSTGAGDVRIAGLLRQLRLGKGEVVTGGETPIVLDEAQTALGIGVSLSGRLNVGERDDVRFMANAGQGLGRYVGVALVNGAAVENDGALDPIFLYSGFASYRHFWSDRWRSNVTLGYFRADNPVALTSDAATDRVYSVHTNVLYSPVPNLTLGVEYLYAQRRTEAGLTGDVSRLQMSARYGF